MLTDNAVMGGKLQAIGIVRLLQVLVVCGQSGALWKLDAAAVGVTRISWAMLCALTRSGMQCFVLLGEGAHAVVVVLAGEESLRLGVCCSL